MNKLHCLLIITLSITIGSKSALSDDGYKTIPERAKEAYEAGEPALHLNSPISLYNDEGAPLSKLLKKYDLLLISRLEAVDSFKSVYIPGSDLITTFYKYKIVERLSTPEHPELTQDSPVPPAGLIPQSDNEILLSSEGGHMCAHEDGTLSDERGCDFFTIYMHPRALIYPSSSVQYIVFVERSAQYNNTGLVVGGWQSALRLETGKLQSDFDSYLASHLEGKTLSEVRDLVQRGAIAPTSLQKNALAHKKSTKKSPKKLRKDKKKKKRDAKKTKRKSTAATVPPTPTYGPIIACFKDYTMPEPKRGETVRVGNLTRTVPLFRINYDPIFYTIPGYDIFKTIISDKDPDHFPGIIETFDPNIIEDSEEPAPYSFKLDQTTNNPDVTIKLVRDSELNGNCADIQLGTSHAVIRISESLYYNNIYSNSLNIFSVIVHELAHFGGLDNTDLTYRPYPVHPYSSIMDNGSSALNDPESKCVASVHARTLTTADRLTLNRIQDPKNKAGMCKKSLYSVAKPAFPGSGSGGDDGGGVCTGNDYAVCYPPSGDSGAYCAGFDGCGIFSGITQCTHNGGGEWDCGQWGSVFFPIPPV